jgi:pseudouridine-5'-phosphate glycosidase
VARVLLVGGLNVDTLARTRAAPVAGTSNPGTTTRAAGGVARNVADNLSRLGDTCTLVGAVGEDEAGDFLLASLAGVDTRAVRRSGRTGSYTAVLDDDGELVIGVADMAATESVRPEEVDPVLTADLDWLVLDGNLLPDTVTGCLATARDRGVPVALDPVGVAKAARLGTLDTLGVHTFTPTHDELAAFTGTDDLAAGRRPGPGTRRAVGLAARGGTRQPAVRDGRPGARGAGAPGPDARRRGGRRDRGRRRDAGRLPARARQRCRPGAGGGLRRSHRGAHPRFSPGGPPGPDRRAGPSYPPAVTTPHASTPPDPADRAYLADRPRLLHCTDEVRAALDEHRPVVALESTIISHGMPYPRNVEMAREVEAIIRDEGAVPATIAVLDGVPRIGLDDAALELLGSDDTVRKVSIRDLPHVIARREHGATTVAATMRLAAAAGIRVFTTGGLGGVHRGAPSTFDESADLVELATTKVTVVSAGVKSILDIGLTLERLETLGVPVVGYGTDEFPAFYTRHSGYAAPLRVDSPEEIAAMMCAMDDLGLGSGISVANPVPAADEVPAERIDAAIAQALADADAAGIRGKDTTPFLLGRIVELTGGESLAANVALVKNNAHLGAQVARSFVAAELVRQRSA